MSEKITGLFEDLCAQLRVADPAAVLASGSLELNGVTVCIEGRDEAESEAVLAYADLGAVPREGAAEILRNLLEANLLWAGTGGATIGLHPDTSHAILAYQTSAEGMTGEALAAALTQFATIAAYWQRFIAEGASAVPTGPGRSDGPLPGMMRV